MTLVKLVFRPQRVVQRLLPGEEKLLNEKEVISIHKSSWLHTLVALNKVTFERLMNFKE